MCEACRQCCISNIYMVLAVTWLITVIHAFTGRDMAHTCQKCCLYNIYMVLAVTWLTPAKNAVYTTYRCNIIYMVLAVTWLITVIHAGTMICRDSGEKHYLPTHLFNCSPVPIEWHLRRFDARVTLTVTLWVWCCNYTSGLVLGSHFRFGARFTL